MRDLAFSLLFAGLSVTSLLNPFAGLLGWSWIAFALPSSSLWGFATALPVNLVIAVSTIVGWLITPAEKAVRPDRMMVILIVLAMLIALSVAFSLAPDLSLSRGRVYAVTFAFLFLMACCLTSKVRIDAFIWMMVLCIGYYSLKGGAAFFISGGAYRFEGPVGTAIADNNHLAVAFLLTLPLLNYLRLHAATAWVRTVLTAALLLTVLAVLCTQSRGGFLGLMVLAAAFWWMSGRRIAHLVAGLLIASIAVAFASEALVSRLHTIESAHQQDSSFRGRVVSWYMHTLAAVDRPLIGAGPYALQSYPVFEKYRPDPEQSIVNHQLLVPVAAHSIYFQVLGEHGFLAFGLYLLLIWTAWRNASWVMRQSVGEPSRLWMYNLASMTRLGIVSFAVAGAAVSMAFYDLFLANLMLTSCLRRQIQRASASNDRESAPASDRRPVRMAGPGLGRYRRLAR